MFKGFVVVVVVGRVRLVVMVISRGPQLLDHRPVLVRSLLGAGPHSRR